MGFKAEEILFSPTGACNLRCAHCDTVRSKVRVPLHPALRLLSDCRRHGVRRVGFTGGEPFLALDFMRAVTKRAVELGMRFDRIMTNGVWFRDAGHLRASLESIRRAGYDGRICVSIDAFHRQNAARLVVFIRTVRSVMGWDGAAALAYVAGARDRLTHKKVARIKKIFPDIMASRIELSAAGNAERLKNAWDGKWFKDDHCRGPGNAFFVTPDGSVKPCCGYATGHEGLTIGNIRRDGCKKLLSNVKKNRLVRTIFGSGLSSIRKRLERSGYSFPGKTSDHCFFCDYIMRNVPKKILCKCLD